MGEEAMPEENPVVAALMRVAEMFGAVCDDPDNPAVAGQADQALRNLDALLAAAPR
jgi:hypothetical protein